MTLSFKKFLYIAVFMTICLICGHVCLKVREYKAQEILRKEIIRFDSLRDPNKYSKDRT